MPGIAKSHYLELARLTLARSGISHNADGQGGGGWYDPPWRSALMVVELRGKNQLMRLDEISRLHILFLVLGQHLT